jgi:hypothetical protein
MSASIASGTSPGRDSTSSSHRWCSTTPPALTPTDSPTMRTGIDRCSFSSRGREEVDVDEATVDVIALDVARDDQVLGAIHDQVDEDVGPGPGVEDVVQVPGVHRQRGRIHPVAVQHRGHATGGPSLRATPLPVPSRGSATSLTSAMFGSFA